VSDRKDLTPEQRQALLDHIESGKPLLHFIRAQRAIDPEFPCRKTIDMIRKRDPEFQADYEDARIAGAHAIAQEALDIIDEVPGRNQYGDYHAGEIARAKHRAYFRLEALKKWFPQLYGDKLELAGDKNAPLTLKLIGSDVHG